MRKKIALKDGIESRKDICIFGRTKGKKKTEVKHDRV